MPVTVAGIDAASPISITGGEYAINDGAFSAATGEVKAGDTVRVRTVASADADSETEAALTIGGVTGRFVARTGPAVNFADVDPQPFTFVPPAEVQPGQVYISEPITVQGINAPAPISITDGTYRIDGGEFTNQAGIVQPGQRVQVRLTAP